MSRLYSIGNKSYPSVTSILSVVGKPAIGLWQRNLSLSWLKQNLQHTFKDSHFDPSETIRNTIQNPEWMDNLIQQAKAHPEEIKSKSAVLGSKAHLGSFSYEMQTKS